MISSSLLKLLCCPETHQTLRPAEPTLVREINEHIAAGIQKNRAGDAVTNPIEEGLVRQDGTVLYPVRNGVPVMLVNEGLPLA